MVEESEHENLAADLDESYDFFIAEAISTGCVWGLEGEEGWALCPSEMNHEIDVMPLWSQPAFAQVQCVDEWSHYKVVPISLEELLDVWLPGMHEDVVFIGPNWNEAMEGLELEPLDVLEDFDKAAA